MKKNTLTFILLSSVAVVGLLILIIGSDGRATNSASTSGEEKKAKQSDNVQFELADYNGKIISSDDFGSKLLVVNTWASWCPFCVDELPDFALLQEAFKEEIVVIAVNRAEPKNAAKDFSDMLGLSDQVLFLVDPSDSFYKSISGFSMPETVFINKKGERIEHKRGPFKFEEMKSIVEALLAND